MENKSRNFWLTWGHEIIVATGFLTILPVPTVEFRPGLLGGAGRWFPLVGAGIGLLLGLAYLLFATLFAPLLVAVVVTGLWAVLTGGLHLDGVADCCDGLLAPVTPERRLTIMRDPRTGAFAVVGLVLLLSLKIAAIASLGQPWSALIVAPTWSRWLLLWVTQQRGARNDGLGAEFRGAVSKQMLLSTALIPLGVVFLLDLLTWQLLFAIGASLLTTWLIVRSARLRLGGTTGDVYGSVIEVSETVVLLAFAAGASA